MKLIKNVTRHIRLLRSNRPATQDSNASRSGRVDTDPMLGIRAAGHGPNVAGQPFPPEEGMRDRSADPDRAGLACLPDGFDPQGYRDRNPGVAHLPDDEAARHYRAVGRFAGLAYRPDQVAGFDPDHFRETHPAFAHAEDAACLDAWRAQGGPDGTPGNQTAHLRRLGLSLAGYPAAFPWRSYTRLYPRAAAHRWAALAYFLDEGFAEVGDHIPYGEDAAAFLGAVADHFASRHHPAAIRAYELAVAHAPSPAARVRLAEAYGRAGAWSAALDLYDDLLAQEEGDEAVLRGALAAAAARGAWPRLFARLPPALARIAPAGEAFARDVTEAYFAERGRAVRALYTEGRREEGDALLAEAVRGVAALSAACLPAGTRADPATPLVLILADGLPDGARHRLERTVALLDGLGHAVRVFDLGTVRAFEAALPEARAAIVVRMPAWPTVVQALVQARRLGVPTLYETDELTIDPRLAPPPLPAFEGRIGERVHEDLVFGVALYRAAATLCDHGLAPTRALARHLDRVVATGRSFVVRDAATPEPGPRHRPQGPGGEVRLFLHAPRTTTLRASDPAGAALLGALRREPRVRLVTAGFAILDEAFAPFADRIAELGPAPDRDAALRDSDLNIVLADGSEAEGCLSATGWLAAARLGIPTLAGDTPGHREALADGVDVRLAADAAGWEDGLAALVARPDLRAAIGAAAAARTAAHHSHEAAADDLRAAIESLRIGTPR